MKNIRLLISALLVFNVCLSATTWAAAREDFAAFIHGVHGLEGTFTQQVIDVKGNVKERSRGSVALALPNLFSWQYQSPHVQRIVADGQHVWIFDEDLNQVTVRDQQGSGEDSALLLLMNPEHIDQQFTVTEQPRQRDGLSWLTLTPKSSNTASFQRAQLGISHAGIEQMEITDNLGQQTNIQFSHWHRNPRFSSSEFRFTPPQGADVIGP